MPGRPPPRQPTPEPAASEAGLDAFRRALYPVLRARDVDAFRQLVADSEDLLGDTADLADWPTTRVRTLMADLLREPRRFGLPRWPALAEQPPSAAPAPSSRAAALERADQDDAGSDDGALGARDLPDAAASSPASAAPPPPVESTAADTPTLPASPAEPTALRPRRRPRRPAPPEQLSLW